MTDENKKDQVEMLQYIRFGHKYKDKKSSFIFIPMDVTLRDQEGNYMGTASITNGVISYSAPTFLLR
jgi:hypothetical protein